MRDGPPDTDGVVVGYQVLLVGDLTADMDEDQVLLPVPLRAREGEIVQLAEHRRRHGYAVLELDLAVAE